MLRRLVLIGGGRAHMRLMRSLAKPLVRGAEVVLVTEERESYNPAMSAGLLRGAYSIEEARIDLVSLSERAGVRLVPHAVSQIDLNERVVLAGAERIPFDLCSLDIVGWPEGADLPGVVDHALPLRPVSALPSVRAALDERFVGIDRPIQCVVVGGGTTGVEAAFALQRLLRDSSRGGVVTIVDGAETILGDGSPCRDLARQGLERAGVCFALGSKVVRVARDRVMLASGAELPADVVLWATAGVPPRAIAESGLPCDARGRVRVDHTLRSSDGAPVWAAGDCAVLEGQDARSEKEESTQLERSVRAALDGASPRVLRGGRSEPCLLDTGDGRALVEWGALHARARWGWWIRQRRDRRFVAEFQRR